MQFSLSVEAEEDIVSIAEQGVRTFGSSVAEQYHEELFVLLELIAANPRMARERHEISPSVRIHPFKAHLVVYRINDDGSIFVIRVRHGHEDWIGDFL
ncbi:type II toxin-antitoxin system RelE/ParE family toxin [Ensifer sp. 2YAB10]|uniref:type II toxin-antitoxin system RelE/ParE family toxin n=1 Tax=unclassified Ensifer TaxID=2633371 RepID=UPI000DE544CF